MTDHRPWLELYPAGLDPAPDPRYQNLAAAWAARVAGNPERVAIRYFDGAMTAAELDAASDALAFDLEQRGVERGDRVGIYLQNVPDYPISLLALWKLGACAVPLNPMYRGGELLRLIDDSGAVGLIVHDAAIDEVRAVTAGGSVGWILSSSDRDYQTRNDERVFSGERPAPSADGHLGDIVIRGLGTHPTARALNGNDLALLTYTSGTTGPAKGAMNSHANVLAASTNYAAWIPLADGDVVFAIAPLFHISGLTLNAGVSLFSDTTLVLANRYNAAVVLDAFAEHEVTFTIGSITAFNAFFEVPGANSEHFRSVKTLYSGGAPIPPATLVRFRERFGHYVHNIWGMTETTGGGIAVPPGYEAPVHAPSGTLSIGVPWQNVTVRIVDASGLPIPPGEQGELELTSPQVISGYWNNAEATASTLPGGALRTGDVAVMDESGWIYLVDRLKDQINASGFKVWPREVEDVLYEHPAVFEAAVIGEPDEYRGETVVAFVSLRPGASASSEELVAFSKERLAAYKYPRTVRIIDALPKTATGKIRRQELRGSGQTMRSSE